MIGDMAFSGPTYLDTPVNWDLDFSDSTAWDAESYTNLNVGGIGGAVQQSPSWLSGIFDLGGDLLTQYVGLIGQRELYGVKTDFLTAQAEAQALTSAVPVTTQDAGTAPAPVFVATPPANTFTSNISLPVVALGALALFMLVR